MSIRHIIILGLLGSFWHQMPAVAAPPNVVLIITDDQGYGDLGCHGNGMIKTAHLDKFASQSVQMVNFCVSPVCAPTRAALMTGRYNYRTGVTDTYRGRAMMHSDEITTAEILGSVGYKTGIFGKWHLGDNYPMRAMDQGFQESHVHRGGGIGQHSDPPGGSSYFDPILFHNGKQVKTKGYCSDVYTDHAIQFITQHQKGPFFVYLPFNCPHTPLQCPKEYIDKYAGLPADLSKIYGMITNIDDNVGRLLAHLDELKLAENTIVIFLTDNGPNGARYTAGLRDKKGSVYEGGIRVPFYIRWPAKLKAGKKVEQLAAHIDVTPTLIEACEVVTTQEVRFDGRSVLPLLQGKDVDWPDRTLFFQWHRGDAPELYRAFTARSQRWKLVQPVGVREDIPFQNPGLELYDLKNDPGEKEDMADERPEIVNRMRQQYEKWFKDVGSTRGYDAPRIIVGSKHENPLILTQQDWRLPDPNRRGPQAGHWEVDVAKEGEYRVTVTFQRNPGDLAHLIIGKLSSKEIAEGDDRIQFGPLRLNRGPTWLKAWTTRGFAMRERGVKYVEIERLN